MGIKGFTGGLFKKAGVKGSETSYRWFNRLHDGLLVVSQPKGWEGAIAVCAKNLTGWFVSPEYRTFRCHDDRLTSRYLDMLKQAYSYTVLRYIHDVVSGESLNVGVVMHAPAASFLKVRTRKTVGRLIQAFPDLDRADFADAMQAIVCGFSAVAKQANKRPLFDARTDARAHALKVLPDDDSALQWSPTGTGLTADPARTFERLYERYVARHDSTTAMRRSDDDVWRLVHDKLVERGIKVPFESKTVVGKQDRIVFEKAWKNGWWHACEPVSLDMTDAEAIMDKARGWRGHLAAVADGASERIDLHFLLGRPQNGSLMSAYETAKAILAHASFATEVVDEKDIDGFVVSMKRASRLGRYADPGVSPRTMNR